MEEGGVVEAIVLCIAREAGVNIFARNGLISAPGCRRITRSTAGVVLMSSGAAPMMEGRRKPPALRRAKRPYHISQCREADCAINKAATGLRNHKAPRCEPGAPRRAPPPAGGVGAA